MLQRQQVQEENPDIPLPSDTLQPLLEDLEVFQGLKAYINHSASSGSAAGSTPSPPKEATMRHPNQLPESLHLTAFSAVGQQLYFRLRPDAQAPNPISKAEPSQPTKDTQF